MRVNPITQRFPVSSIAKTARIRRSDVTAPDNANEEKPEQDLAERRQTRPRLSRLAAPTATSGLSHDMLSALIDLQIKNDAR